MPINVVYQVPTSLMQQQRQAERRAYRRQVNLMTMQQNFQREQTEANRQFQRETMQTAYDRQREKTADERAYQQELLAHKEGREDAIRKQAMELAEKQRMEQQIQQAETMLWQDSERRRQALEKDFNYSSAQQAELKQLEADELEAHEQKMQGVITPEQYLEALSKIRQQKSAIMPDTPKRPEETMSLEDRIKSSTMWHPELKCLVGMNSKGEVYTINPPQDSVSAKLKRDKVEALNNARKSCMVDGVLNQKEFDKAKKEIEEIYGVDNGNSAQPKFNVPQTSGDYINANKGGGNPLQQMMGQQQPQMPQQPQEQPQPQSQPMQTPEEIQQLEKKIEDAAAEQLSRWKADARKQAKANFLRKRQGGEDIDSAKRQYREHMKSIDDATEIPRTKQTKQAEQPKKEEPKRQTTSVTFNGISDINGLKAWVNGKRLAVGDEMPGGGKITDLDFDNGTLTYELDGKKYTIRKSRNAQNI